jgi:hypothetical protein
MKPRPPQAQRRWRNTRLTRFVAQRHARTRSGGHAAFIQTPRSARRDHDLTILARSSIAFDAAPVGLNAPKQTLRVSQTGGSATRPHPFRGRVASVLIALSGLLLIAPAAQADFGFLPGAEGFNVTATEANGSIDNRAGSHPYALTTTVNFNLAPESAEQPGGPFTDGDLKDLHLELPPGLIENPAAVPQCTLAQFNTPRSSPFETSLSGESCPDKTQVGVIAVHTSYGGGSTRTFGVFNLVPPAGAPSQLGFSPFGVPITLTPRIRGAEGEYGLTLDSPGFSQLLDVYGFKLTLWGTPWAFPTGDPETPYLFPHDRERGNCLNEEDPTAFFGKPASYVPSPAGPIYREGTCSTGNPKLEVPKAYLTLPSACAGPMETGIEAGSWQQPAPVRETSLSRDAEGHPQALEGCGALGLAATPTVQPSTERAASPSGLDFTLNSDAEGLLNPSLVSPSPVKKAVVALPEGLTINPSLGAGLGVCTPAQYAAETVSSAPGAGCPNASKIGDFTVESPLLESQLVKGQVKGSLFLARPFDNPFNSLLAFYLVARSAERGILVKVDGQLAVNPASGQLTATFDGLPQLPYSHLNVHFREGQRSPLATPAVCGKYSTPIDLTPWFDPGAIFHQLSSFPLSQGVGGGPCPSGTPPFNPGAQAGTLNSNAGSYTPFYLHLTRLDNEQEITSYSAKLPPGLLGKLAGIPYCPEADIEAAKRETGVGEEQYPSCPAASEIGHTIAGYGVGAALTTRPASSTSPAPSTARPSRSSRSTPPRSAPSTSASSSSARRSRSTLKRPRSRSTPPARTRSPTSATASPCTCATSASTSLSPTSPSTRPAAIPSRRPRR